MKLYRIPTVIAVMIALANVCYYFMPFWENIPTIHFNITNESSPCSEGAWNRGPHQNVVSFSFYTRRFRTLSDYFQGIEANAKLVQLLYPGWMMRVYHEEPNSNSMIFTSLSKLQHRYHHLDLCYVENISGLNNIIGNMRMVWRFYPIADSQVDVFLSRDLDSRLSEREKMAVDEWLESNLTMHIMRDHPSHTQPVLGGMWGVKVFQKRDILLKFMEDIISRTSGDIPYGGDMAMLGYFLWPLMTGDVMQHDSYYCTDPWFVSYGNVRPWPSQRTMQISNFVGSNTRYIRILNISCPKECRPKDHQDWFTC